MYATEFETLSLILEHDASCRNLCRDVNLYKSIKSEYIHLMFLTYGVGLYGINTVTDFVQQRELAQ